MQDKGADELRNKPQTEERNPRWIWDGSLMDQVNEGYWPVLFFDDLVLDGVSLFPEADDNQPDMLDDSGWYLNPNFPEHLTHARLTQPDLPASLTICTSYYVSKWTDFDYLFVMVTPIEENYFPYPWFSLQMTPKRDGVEYEVMFIQERFQIYSHTPKFPKHWTHACLSYNSSSRMLGLVVDGSFLKQFDTSVQDSTFWDTNLDLRLGGFPYGEASGMTTNLNIFGSSLPRKEMERITGGLLGKWDCESSGDYLGWVESWQPWLPNLDDRMAPFIAHPDHPQWNFTTYPNVRMLMTPIAEPCKLYYDITTTTIALYTGDDLDHKGCMKHCQKIGGGRAPPVNTLHQLEKLRVDLMKIPSLAIDHSYMWLPLTDENSEGLWYDWYDQTQLGNYQRPWRRGYNSRGENYNCIVVRNSLTKINNVETAPLNLWWEEECHTSTTTESFSTYQNNISCACDNAQQPISILRGLCQKNIDLSIIDFRYTPIFWREEGLRHMGQLATEIIYNKENNQWELINSIHQSRAVSKNLEWNTLALGKHDWQVSNDHYRCNNRENYTTTLKLTGCEFSELQDGQVGGEFTCDDGECIGMAQRCDQLPDCADGSDERGCQLLVLPDDGYNLGVPPITAVSQTNRTIVPVAVTISIVLMKIVGMEETQHAVDFQFEIVLEWKESRAVYHNLKQETSLNALTEDDISRLWLPLVIYDNTDQKMTTSLGDWRTVVAVVREGNFTRSDISVTDEIEIFRGGENTLSMRQVYTHRFQCQFYLHYYPFDTQVTFVLVFQV